ncbi:MAG: hypothetical protein GY860_07605 [Desulfobacteraceae bacterium]|nr:hypothetical protein [Desulfobacteraceae bacterium]
MKNSGRYTEVTFDLTESNFQYLGGIMAPLALDRHKLKTVLAIQFPIEILEIQKKKRRGQDSLYYRVCLSIHRSDMESFDITLKQEYPKDHSPSSSK